MSDSPSEASSDSEHQKECWCFWLLLINISVVFFQFCWVFSVSCNALCFWFCSFFGDSLFHVLFYAFASIMSIFSGGVCSFVFVLGF